jgi:hypothetical protein
MHEKASNGQRKLDYKNTKRIVLEVGVRESEVVCT